MGNKSVKSIWSYNSPTFEFTKELPVNSSAWSGHYFFAYDLVSNVKPKIIVELGTHKGNSLFSFAQAIKDNKLDTELHGIDSWEGEKHAGYYDESVYENFLKISKEYYKNVNIVAHKMYFDDAVTKFKDSSIDILHVDGLHTYDAVKHDFETWLPRVNKETGIVLFHDVCEKSRDFGVYILWEELKKRYKTITFDHYHGLGVLFVNKGYKIVDESVEQLWTKYYPSLSKIQDLEEEIYDKENHIRNITSENLARLKMTKELLAEKDIYKKEAKEYQSFKQTKIWKGLTIYRKIKRYFKNFFINIVKDGPIITIRRIIKRLKNVYEYRQQLEKNRNPYKYWLKKHEITFKKRFQIKRDLEDLEYKPLISIVMPVYNVDVKWIKEAVKSVKKQIYTNWELCIADDASTDPELKKYLKNISKDSRIKVTFRKKNGHISEASNSALELAEGEFIALMDNDDIIHPHALAEVVKLLNEKPDTDFIYSDEDKIDMTGKRVEPFFKPDWSPDLFMSTNYMSHLSVIRKELIDKVGGFRKGYEGSQDYDLFLRIVEKTNRIEHIPDVLYSWRKIPGSTASEYSDKVYAQDTTIKALQDSLKRKNLKGDVYQGLFPGSFRVKYNIKGNPLVSIIIPTLEKYEYLERCLSSILEKTTYDNFEIIIVDTGSKEQRVLEYYELLKQDKRIKIPIWKERFNYSGVNNFGVKHAKGQYLLLLNNDTEIISPNWIEGMLEHAQRKEVGAVGVKLLYPNNTIQHAGVILGINGGTGKGVAGHAFKYFPREIQGFPVQKDIIKNYSAVTAACLMIDRKKYEEVRGLEEKFRIAFNDVDFCLKLLKKGYYNVYTPYVELYHHESISVGTPESKTRDNDEFSKEIDLMYKKWEKNLLNDPFYNKNLSLKSEDFKISIE